MKYLSILIIGLLSFNLLGQVTENSHRVWGVVNDSEAHTALQFVTVTLQDIESGELTGDVTDKNGRFELYVREGNYYCIVESLSFSPFVIQVLQVSQDIDMGVIELKQNSENLEEIELVAKANLIDHRMTKKVYNASKDIANIGGNAITVLENTPSVRVDEQGNISMRGNTVLVLVDGKPYGGQRSRADVLSLIPSNTIDKVEIITQSAKFDSEGGGGILNIILKKRASEGYNGSVEVHAGMPDNDGISSYLNYRTDKVQIFSTASFNHSVQVKDTDLRQEFFDNGPDPIGAYEQQRNDYRQRNSFLLNIGSDFYLDANNTLTTSLLYSGSNNNYDSKMSLEDFRPPTELFRTADRRVDDNSDASFLEAYVQYTAKFRKEGHQLSADIKYDNNLSDNLTYILETETYPGDEDIHQKYSKDERADNVYFKLDYVLPLQRSAKLEAGHKTNFRNYENDFAASNMNASNGQWVPDGSLYSRIGYEEKIYSFYVNYSQEKDRWSYSLGLRTEITETLIAEKNIQEEFRNDYTDLFPSALVTYDLENQNYFSLGYSRFIDRPSISQLNPFNSFADQRFILLGNPYLQPYYTNYFYLEYFHEFEKLSLNSALFYSNSTDRIMDILEKTGNQTADGFDIYRRVPVNNGTLDFAGLEIEATYNPNNKLRLYGLISPYYANLSETREAAYDFDNMIWYGNFRVLYKLSETFRFNIDYYFQTAKKTALTELKSFQYANLSLSKDFFEGKATLTFKVNDLFHTKMARYVSTEANTLTHRDFIFDTQYLLSFSYRFNKSSRKSTQNRAKEIEKNIFEIEDRVE